MSEKYIVYTDGACSNNQAAGGQPGGWGAVFLNGQKLSGGDLSTTNNRMELTAVIEALKATPHQSEVEIYSDSAYVINAFEKNWIPNWIKRGWKTSQGKPVENQDLWKDLIPLVKDRKIIWKKVKGHSGDKWNELADQLAVAAIPKGNFKQQSEVLTEDENRNTRYNEENRVNKEGLEEELVTLIIPKQSYMQLTKLLSWAKDKNEKYLPLYNQIKNSKK